MSHDPHAQFDQSVMEMIERSPIGAVPHTTSYDDALTRLYSAHQIYPSADHKGGHVTARSLAARPVFHASNLELLIAGQIEAAALESNDQIFDRYLQSLPAAERAGAESHRGKVGGRAVHHRKHHGAEDISSHHDPVHSLFLVPGTGPHHGLPGNYLHGSLFQSSATGETGEWAVHVHDADDATSFFDAPNLSAGLAKLQELLESAPFHLSELEALGFGSK